MRASSTKNITQIEKYIFSESQYSYLYPKGYKFARLYGIPKIHISFSPGSIPSL